MRQPLFPVTALAILAAHLCGCGLSKPYPAKQYYSIDVPAPSTSIPDRVQATLRVAPVRIAPPFDAQAFQYNTKPNQFESDYYVNFVTQPGDIITGELTQYLSAAGPYAVVVDGTSSVSTSRMLETRVSTLCGDYTDTPQAVVIAKIFLLDTRTADARVLFEKEYSQSVPLSGQDPASLVSGWADALQQMVRGALPRSIDGRVHSALEGD